ncbi:MAG: hypothetical protein AB2544_19225, partial [Candidatus Thiodiazotropha endolucinida]
GALIGCRDKRGRKGDWDVPFRILSVTTLLFCISFGGNGKTKTHPSYRQHYYRPPPPLLLAPPVTAQPRLEPAQPLPAIAPVEEEPVIIQGYRFRPLPQE